MRDGRSLFLLGFAVLGLLGAVPAHATLGGSVDSIEQDRSAMDGIKHALTPHCGAGCTSDSSGHFSYTIEDIESDAISVREYVSSTGVVFALAWNGLGHPDLPQLLGAYTPEFRQAAEQATRVPGRRNNTLSTPKLVVERWGKMRDLQGRAYDPALLPQGVNVDEIK